jgi:RNA polymerase sigma-70 factor, ECF subfamily
MPGAPDAMVTQAKPEALDDDELVQRVRAGDLGAFELLMRRHNQKLYRAVRSVLRSGFDIEDTMQDTYLAAYKNLHQFEGRAKFATWLLKIGINEALARVRRRICLLDLDQSPEESAPMEPSSQSVRTPEEQASDHQLVAIVEAAIDRLPEDYRQVLMLRGVESFDTADTAEVLGMTAAAVKQRLHRAREMLQQEVAGHVGGALQSAFGFMGDRCDLVVASVMYRIRAQQQPNLEP